MKTHLLPICFCSLIACACLSYSSSDPLEELDKCVANRAVWQQSKQHSLDSLSRTLTDCTTQLDTFEIYGRLVEQYRSFSIDSQLAYTQRRIRIAEGWHNPFYTQLVLLNMAEVYMMTGMFAESLHLCDSAIQAGVYNELRPYYYHLSRTLYGLLGDYSITDEDRDLYYSIADTYRDSMLHIHEAGTFLHTMVLADQNRAHGDYTRALQLMGADTLMQSMEASDQAAWAFTRARIYRGLGHREKEKQALIIAAIHDLRGAVREYISLRDLAMLLYEEGDIVRSYRYMECAMQDAVACGARWRTLEINEASPVITSAYRRMEYRQRIGLIVAMVLALAFLTVLLLYTIARQRQMRILQTTQQQLRDSNQIKTVYIGHYLQVYSFLVDRFDAYRRELYHLAQKQQIDKLTTALHSQQFIQEQVNAFHNDFDEAFLAIFPNYIEKMRALLRDEVELKFKPGEKLNTDLRVYALIRLGITDSRKIASMLRLSDSTVFNARTRMRNNSRYPKEEFELKAATLSSID